MNLISLKPNISISSLYVWQRHRDVFFKIWKTESLGIGLEPWIVILAMGFGLGQFVTLDSGEKYVQFLAPGLMAMFPMFAAIFECGWGAFMRISMHGTYEAILNTPASIEDITTGDILWGTTRATLNATYILIVLLILNHWTDAVNSPYAIGIVFVAILQGFLFSSIAIAFAALARAMSHFGYLFNIIVMPMFWLSGGFFPINELPEWAQNIAWFLPLIHSVELNRALLNGNLTLNMIGDFFWLAIVAIAFYAIALVLMRRRLIV